jgi:hypothetical protein
MHSAHRRKTKSIQKLGTSASSNILEDFDAVGDVFSGLKRSGSSNPLRTKRAFARRWREAGCPS